MLSYLRLTSCTLRTQQCPCFPSSSRIFTKSISSTSRNPPSSNPPEDDSSVPAPKNYREFLERVADPFREANKPRNWLGEHIPFPMNPSFQPPSPVSNTLRTRLYKEFMDDPRKNSVRALSERYYLSLKRVDAILRLKGQEEAWLKERKPLQTGFQSGMEMLLGVHDDEKFRHMLEKDQKDPTRYDVYQSDALEQEENRDVSRQRYQRMYWESVPEDGKEPITPEVLEHAVATAKKIAKNAEKYKANRKLMPIINGNKNIRSRVPETQTVEKPGRPTMVFVDVKGKFINVDERLRRIADGKRRSKMKQRQRAEREKI